MSPPVPPRIPRRPVPTATSISPSTSASPITICPENDPLYATAFWYSIPGVPGFETCSHCYASHIRQTRWADRFHGELQAPTLTRRCRFNTPRARQLWSEALRRDDWASVSAYWARRAQIADCQGARGLAADVGTQWFHPTHRDIDGFGICAACYEDLVCGTSLAGRLTPANPGQPAGELWSCKMTPYLRRVLLRAATHNDWVAFSVAALQAARLPACPGSAGVAASKRSWFQPVPAIDGLVVCETCYINNVAASFMETNWVAVPAAPAFTAAGWQTRVCGFSVLPLKIACLKATQDQDYPLLWRAAKTIFSTPYCAPAGIENGTWHRLRCGQDLEFELCAQCMAGIMVPFGFGDRFVQIPFPAGTKRLCDMNTSAPRQRDYYRKLDEAVSLGDFTCFETYARRFAGVPPCPTYNIVKGCHRWYGNDEFLACQQCWEEFVRDTPLANNLVHKGVVLPDGACCDLYSPRMRQLWMQACNTGDLASFTAAAQHRTSVYAQTVPHMQELLAMARMRLAQKQTLLFSSVMLQGANNIVEASRAPRTQTTTYGNSQVGYHATPAGAQGARDWHQANNITVVPGNEMVVVAQLEAMWKEVE
ncbi:hypothetical protein ASPZODRAFT_151960 [Penicilliopsis zonata CBS 506.65]|uniref:Integral membrane protein n=1 Tax=Penicilliopsis zonata CBS 506.65 TaxID=1073090 RepID=A0A1L9SGK8_9EURO|nr:hypothetical protein ASPZODRAFT_151960 [Penicilliopsis zonata CBS 506.65]OJJ46405.1 hypothetical protein ASPZODRAFT_151960 [Penicilliopsis zonata CBS 506.65]